MCVLEYGPMFSSYPNDSVAILTCTESSVPQPFGIYSPISESAT